MKKNERRSVPLYKKIVAVIVSIILLLIQIAFYWFFFFGVNKFEYVYITVQVIGIIMVFRIYGKRLNASYKLSWIIFILLFSFAGTMAYLFFGNGRTIPKRKSKKISAYLDKKNVKNNVLNEIKEEDLTGYKLAQGVHVNTDYPLYKNNNFTFFPDTLFKHKDLLNELSKAKKYIFIEYFIVCEGSLLEEILQILEQKGKQGVEIKLLYDDIGSKTLISKETLQRIKKIPNLKVSIYEPLGININFAINYRDHRKIVVIDGEIAYVGGDNLADEYIHRKQRFGYWRDNSCKIEGDSVYSFVLLFCEMWYMSCKEMLEVKKYKGIKVNFDKKNYIMPFGDGPTNQRNPAYDLFKSMFGSANKYIYISTPYLIIDQEFINAIALAAKNGVDVRILTPHIPDKKTVFMMTRNHYGEILKAGGHIYEYSFGFNHAKNIIVDDQYAFIGTVNLDYRSLLLHFECGALVMHDDEILKMKRDFIDTVSDCEEITLEKWENRSIFEKLFGLVMNIFGPLL